MYFVLRCGFCNLRSDPGQVILTMLNDAEIDVEKMKEEEQLPEDGERNVISSQLRSYVTVCAS